MVKNLLYLRCKQAVRLIKQTGVGVVIMLLLVSLGFILWVLEYLTFITALQFFGIASLALATIHFSRADLQFLQSISVSKVAYYATLFFEYLLVLTPFIAFFIYFQRWEVIGLALLAPLIVALIPNITVLNKSETKVRLDRIPLANFEIKTHMERYFPAYVALLIVGLLSAVHISLFILFCLFFGMSVFGAFDAIEPKELIQPSSTFIIEKLKRNLKLVLFLSFPIFSIAAIFQRSFLLVVVYFYLAIFLSVTLGILYKYAFANPLFVGRNSTVAKTIFFIMPFIPGMIVINIGYQIYLWFKATNNLKYHYA